MLAAGTIDPNPDNTTTADANPDNTATVDPNPDNTATANGANLTEFTDRDDFDNTTATDGFVDTTATNTGNTTDDISIGEANNTGGNVNTVIPSAAPTTDVIGGGSIAGTDNAVGQLTGTVDPIPGGNTGEAVTCLGCGIGVACSMYAGRCHGVVSDTVAVLFSSCQPLLCCQCRHSTGCVG